MSEELRKTGISVVGDVPWGTHFCSFYDTQHDLLDIVIPYFKTGLEDEEFCLWIISNSELLTAQEARNALNEVNLDRYVAERSIELVGHDDWFLNGHFDLHRVANRFKEKVDEALGRGYAGMRVNGSPAWIQTKDPEELREFEEEVDVLFRHERIIASCTYPIGESRADFLLDVARNHQFAITRRQGNWEVLETPELTQAKQEIQRLNEELEQRVVERTRELAAANEELRREIAERRRAEDALRYSEERLRLVIDTVPALIHTGLPDGSLDYFNQRWLEYVGLSLDDLLGWKWTAAIHPDDVVAMVDGWRAARARGEPFEHESRVRRADGEYRWMFHRDVPLRDERGNIVKWYASSIDIEDRKRAEEALRRSEDQLRLVIDTIPVMAWSLRPDGVVDFLNQRWMDYAGLSLEQYVQDPAGPIHPEDVPRVFEKWRAQMAIGEGYEDEMRLRRADGIYRWFIVRTEPLRDEQGNIVKWYGVSIDIEDRKRAEEQLKATSEQLRSLSARLQSAREEESKRIAREIHDELGGALTTWKWDLEEIRDTISEPLNPLQVAALRTKIEVMTKLTETTLDTVRKLASELRPMALELGLLEGLEWQVLQFENRTGVEVRLESSVEKVDLDNGQATAVFRILQEALTNIQRHAQATKVTIRVNQDSGQFFLEIQDNGRGFTKGQEFDRQSLGLVGMRERAHLAGAEINIESAAGKGTRITVQVPLSNEGRRLK